ncbi:MAG: GIY-YIG nuclease family protein [Dehalococcoidia bacterium]
MYVLRSVKKGRRYTGSTLDVARRLSEHNSGKGPYAKAGGPFELLHTEAYESRQEAVRRERYLKSAWTSRTRPYSQGKLREQSPRRRVRGSSPLSSTNSLGFPLAGSPRGNGSANLLTTMTTPVSKAFPVYLESGNRRVFACALDWPGWCRSWQGRGRSVGEPRRRRQTLRPGGQNRGCAFSTAG